MPDIFDDNVKIKTWDDFNNHTTNVKLEYYNNKVLLFTIDFVIDSLEYDELKKIEKLIKEFSDCDNEESREDALLKLIMIGKYKRIANFEG